MRASVSIAPEDAPIAYTRSGLALRFVISYLTISAIACVWRALQPGGRFVLEMGGHGNTGRLLNVVREVVGPVESPWYFPSVGEY